MDGEARRKELKKLLNKTLRNASMRWKGKTIARQNARRARGKYECAECGPKKLYGPKEVQMDHIEPVCNISTGFIDWNEYIDRMFCFPEGYQALCKPHHQIKTQLENATRNKLTKASKSVIIKRKKGKLNVKNNK